MQFDLADLRLMAAIAETDSLTRGAERAHTSVSAASIRIKNLEERIGAKLLYRSSQGVKKPWNAAPMWATTSCTLHPAQSLAVAHSAGVSVRQRSRTAPRSSRSTRARSRLMGVGCYLRLVRAFTVLITYATVVVKSGWVSSPT